MVVPNEVVTNEDIPIENDIQSTGGEEASHALAPDNNEINSNRPSVIEDKSITNTDDNLQGHPANRDLVVGINSPGNENEADEHQTMPAESQSINDNNDSEYT